MSSEILPTPSFEACSTSHDYFTSYSPAFAYIFIAYSVLKGKSTYMEGFEVSVSETSKEVSEILFVLLKTLNNYIRGNSTARKYSPYIFQHLDKTSCGGGSI